MHDDDWTFTSMDAKIGSPTFHTWGLKSIRCSYNIHTHLSVISSNVAGMNMGWVVEITLNIWIQFAVQKIQITKFFAFENQANRISLQS